MAEIVVPFLDLGAAYVELRSDLDDAHARVMRSGRYLIGPELDSFERDFAGFSGAAHCAGVGSGLDALTLSLRALDVGPGDEVIVPSNTYIATWLAVSAVGATIIPVEPDVDTFNLTGAAVDAAVTPRTAAILPVHLYGLPADVHGIADVAGRHGIPVLYDAAQAHGASVDGAPVGSYGDITAWSFYPGKNLGAFADGGAVTTDDAALVARVRRLRNYGSDTKYENIERGVNSRLDELQAAFLSVRLRSLNEWNERRRHIAEAYVAGLSDIGLRLPVEPAGSRSVWHVFAIRLNDRDSVQCELDAIGVQTFIHYPIPPHRQIAYADLDLRDLAVADRMAAELLSLPIGPHQTEEQTATVLAALRAALRAS